MANSDKNIIITPNKGSSTENPEIEFTGSDNVSSFTTVDDDGTVNFLRDSANNLLSISNNVDETVFTVNNEDGIPIFSAKSDGSLDLIPYSNGVVSSSNMSSSVVSESTNTVEIDFSDPNKSIEIITTDLSIQITGKNYIPGVTKIIKINPGTLFRDLFLPSNWVIAGYKPQGVSNWTTAVITATSYGNDATDCIASYSEQRYQYQDGAIAAPESLMVNFDFSDVNTYPMGGNTAYDSSGLGWTATLNDPVFSLLYTSDDRGVLEFDGINDVVTTSFAPAANLPGATVTFEAWVYDTKNNAAYRSIIQHNEASDDALYVNPSNYLHLWPCGASTLTVPANQWNYVAASYDGTKIIYCVNGTFQTVTGVCADAIDFDFVRIGGQSTADGQRWKGAIGVARVYRKALSQEEMTQNYLALRSRFDPPIGF